MQTKFLPSRRQFLKSSTALAALAAASPFVLRSETEKTLPKAATHKFCAFEKPLQFLSYDELAELMSQLGFDGIEAAVRPGGHVLPEKVEDDLPRMIEALKKRGLEMTVLTSGINGVDSPHA